MSCRRAAGGVSHGTAEILQCPKVYVTYTVSSEHEKCQRSFGINHQLSFHQPSFSLKLEVSGVLYLEMEMALAAIGLVSAVESTVCAARLWRSLQTENDVGAAGIVYPGRITRRLKSVKHAKDVPEVPIALFDFIHSEARSTSGAGVRVYHQVCACDEARRQSLHKCNNLNDMDSLLEFGIDESSSGAYPVPSFRRPVSPSQTMYPILNRRPESTERKDIAKPQWTVGEAERPVTRDIRELCDAESHECAPEPEKSLLYPSVVDQTGDRMRARRTPRWHPRRFLNRGPMTATRLTRLLGGVFLLFPSCMVVMSNYAITRGLFTGSNSWDQDFLEVSIPPTNEAEK